MYPTKRLSTHIYPPMRTKKVMVYVVENSTGSVFNRVDELHTMKVSNPAYQAWLDGDFTIDDKSLVPNKTQEANCIWHKGISKEEVPRFSSAPIARDWWCEHFGYKSLSQMNASGRYIRGHEIEVPVESKPTHDNIPLEKLPKRMRSTLKHYHQRHMLWHLQTDLQFRGARNLGLDRSTWKALKLVRERKGWLRNTQGILNTDHESLQEWLHDAIKGVLV